MLHAIARPAASIIRPAIPRQPLTSFAQRWSTRVPTVLTHRDHLERAMSTAASSPYTIRITPDNTGLLKFEQTEDAAEKASTLLQEDLEKHHVFFNQDGFHNHIPHHILALYGTGAPSTSLQAGYDHNTPYQRPAQPTHLDVVQSLIIQTWNSAQSSYLGKEQHYPDFLRFFQHELETSSIDSVLTRYLFSGKADSVAAADDDMLVRLYAGFLHPLIQLMYGVEWAQPAVVAEALAQTAVHSNEIGEGFLLPAERLAASKDGEEREVEGEMPSILELLEQVRRSEKLRGAVRNEDGNKVRDGVLKRAREDILQIAARVRVKATEEEVERRTAEMFDACVYMAGAAAVREGKASKWDFFLIHHVNTAPIFLTLNAQPWLPIKTKARILEWKIRMDLLQYAARGVPILSIDKISNHRPKNPQLTVPRDIISRLHDFLDDGHAIKLGRAALICHDHVSRLHKEGKLDGVKLAIDSDELWNKVFHLIVDSVEAPGPTWVRSCGLEEAWTDVPDADADDGGNHKL